MPAGRAMMPPETLHARRWRRRARVVLVLGWSVALAVGLFGEDRPADVLGYEFAGGEAYELQVSDSKRYRSDLERIGGKAAVFADDLNRWFAGLWQGRRLAWTIASLSTIAALGCGWMGRR